MSDELEPLGEDVSSLLRALPAPATVSPAARAQVLERIGNTLLAAPPLVAGAGAGAAAASLSAKVVVTLLLAGAVPAAVAGFLYGRASAPTPEPRVVVREVPVMVAPPSPSPSAPPPPAPPEPVVAPRETPRNEAPRVTPPDGRPLVEAARTALLKSDAPRALELLREHAQRFPQSQLAEERAALEIQALLLSGDVPRARAAATAFKARWKNSVFSSVADAALEGN
jgi:hypothetical protein